MLYKHRIFQCKGQLFCVEFQKHPLKFHTKYLTHSLKFVYFVKKCKFESSKIYEFLKVVAWVKLNPNMGK